MQLYFKLVDILMIFADLYYLQRNLYLFCDVVCKYVFDEQLRLGQVSLRTLSDDDVELFHENHVVHVQFDCVVVGIEIGGGLKREAERAHSVQCGVICQDVI